MLHMFTEDYEQEEEVEKIFLDSMTKYLDENLRPVLMYIQTRMAKHVTSPWNNPELAERRADVEARNLVLDYVRDYYFPRDGS